MTAIAPKKPFNVPTTEQELDAIFGSADDHSREAIRRGRAAVAERAFHVVEGSPSPRLEVVPEPFPVVHLLKGAPPPPASVHIRDWMLDGDLNLWCGHGSAGKGILLSATAISIALGRPLFGTLPVLRSGPVLLSLPEDGEGTARMVYDALVQGMELTGSEAALLQERVVMIPDDVGVNITSDTRRLGETALAHEAVAVILDPLANHLNGASEREEEIATHVCDSLRRNVCRYAGASIAMAHHLRKPGKEGGEGPATVHDIRGSGGWVNSSRLAFSVTKKNGANRITVSALKSNRLRADIRHELNLEIIADNANPALWLSCKIVDANMGASSETLTVGVGRSLNSNEQAVLSALDDRQEPGKRLSWSRWEKTSGINPNTFKSIKERLIDAGIVAALATGKRTRNGSPEYGYEITPLGRKALDTGWVTDRERVKG